MKTTLSARPHLRRGLLVLGAALLAGHSLHAYPLDGSRRRDDDYEDAVTAARLQREAEARAVHRDRWRGTYTRPAGYALYRYGGYTYYRAGSTYYTPYFYGGRTVYLQVKTQDGKPLPPPPPNTIEIDFN